MTPSGQPSTAPGATPSRLEPPRGVGERAHDTTRSASSAELQEAWNDLFARFRGCDDYTLLLSQVRDARRLEARIGPPPEHRAVRVAWLPGAASQLLEGPLELALLAAGLAPRLHVAPFGQGAQQMLDPASATSRFRPELALVTLTPHAIPRWPEADATPRRAQELAEAVCDELLEPCRALHERTGCEVVLDTFAPLVAHAHGNLAAKRAGTRTNFLRRLNVVLGDRAPRWVHLNDVTWLVERHGLDRWLDLVYWYHAKQPVAFPYVADYVRNVAAVAGACFGRTRKCLVVDLDNTLWGGVVGDDGVEGLVLGEGSAAGEAYKAFQEHLTRLRERGVLLAACSKNDPETARRPFREHPEMVLREDDLAAFHAGWGPKSDALRAIAASLDLGLDALVFADDNPAEREEVRRALPQVAVPELGVEPADYPRILDAGRYFEVVAVSDEDRRRTESYRIRHQARELRGESSDLEGFLASLEMRARLRPFRPVDMQRITQLVNKTNQFNLTTPRCSRSELEALARDPERWTLTARLADRLGDHGLVCVAWGRRGGSVLAIEAWLMSCRVIGRRLERLVLEEIVRVARERGCGELRGTYVPTARNGLVREHYAELGFAPAAGGEWSLHLDAPLPRPAAPIRREEELACP